MAKRRELTPSEVNAAERLQTIWNAKKKALGLTQEKVAQLCEWSNQSAFGAYLLARVPLNTDAVLRLAKVFKVHPTEIMPELAALLPESSIKKAELQKLSGVSQQMISQIESEKVAMGNGEMGHPDTELSREEELILKIFRQMSSSQKNETLRTFENTEQENELIIKEYQERTMNRRAA